MQQQQPSLQPKKISKNILNRSQDKVIQKSDGKESTRPVNIQNPTDYREISKTLQQLQKNNPNFSPTNFKLSPNNALAKPNELFDFQALQNSGILNHLRMEDGENKPGSLEVKLEDIERAFKILDEKNNGQKISLNELKKKVPILNPSFPINDIQSLTNGKQEIKAKELFEILQDNELENLDLFRESFQLLDPLKSGFLDNNRLRQIFQAFGYGDINKKDMEILHEALDADGDGKISFEDLKKVFDQSEIQTGFK